MMYFAYGSNMDPKRMKTRIGHANGRRYGLLRDYRLLFNKQARDKDGNEKRGEGKTNIVPEGNQTVEGALYEISESELAVLDGFEIGYAREMKPVELQDGTRVDAWVYVADEEEIRGGLRPSRKYLKHLLKGRDILSEDGYRGLEATETLD